MKLVPCHMPKESGDYLHFMKQVYCEDPHYLDYVTPVAAEVFKGLSPFAKHLEHQSFWVMRGAEKRGTVTFLIHDHYSHVLQLAFFEYLQTPELAQFVLEEAKVYAVQKGCNRVVFGLNGHVNYGLGLSLSHSHKPSFGAPYCQLYYSADFKALGCEEKTLSAYNYPWGDKTFPLSEEKMERLSRKMTVRPMTPQSFDEDMKIYTDLNNQCFQDHDFYYPRTYEEDLALFKDLRFFLSKGSLIFAEQNGKPIGFLLWYPDWSQVMKRGETLSVGTFLKTLVMKPWIKSFKIVEWAVLPEYRRMGVPIGLLYACYQIVSKANYTHCKTSWILDENKDSNGFGIKWGEAVERYAVYSISLEGQDHE